MASFCMLVRVGVLGFVDLLKLSHSEKDLGLELDDPFVMIYLFILRWWLCFILQLKTV